LVRLMRLEPVDECAPPIIDLCLLSERTQRDPLEREANQFYLRHERAVLAIRLFKSTDRHNMIGVHPNEWDTSGVDDSTIERDKVHAVSILNGSPAPLTWHDLLTVATLACADDS
jgi:hypothetical protein